MSVRPADPGRLARAHRRQHQCRRVPRERAVGLGRIGRDRERARSDGLDPGTAHGLPARIPAQRSASAMMTSAGLAAPSVGSTLPSTTNRLGTPHTRWSESTTLFSGAVPILAPPTRWAKRSIFSVYCAPADWKIRSIVSVPNATLRLSLSHIEWEKCAIGIP